MCCLDEHCEWTTETTAKAVMGNKSRFFVWCPRSLRELVVHPFPEKQTLPIWGVLSSDKAMMAQGWTNVCKMNLSFLPFCMVILKFFGPMCCSSFLRKLRALPELVLLVDSCLIVDLCSRMELGSSTLPSWLHHSTLNLKFCKNPSYLNL